GSCSTTLDTRTFSTPSDTPKWRPTDSRTFGGTDDGGAGSIAPARKILPFEEDDAPCRRDHSSAGARILRGMRSCGPIAVSTSIISRFGLRLDDSFSRGLPSGSRERGRFCLHLNQVRAPNRLSRRHFVKKRNRTL